MTRMLVVASPTLGVLSTDGPIPTDGQPEHRHLGPKADCRDHHGDVRTRIPHDHTAAWVFDGPYPFTVAVWQEVWHCGRCKLPKDDPNGCYCGYVTSYPVGAVVAAVEVTGPSHHADDCAHDAPGEVHGGPQGRVREVERRYCHPDALPDCWHTPTSVVSRLDVPIPMERPPVDCPGPASPHTFHREWSKDCPECGPDGPASWWWADLDLEAAP